jgi:hypothetical protein
MPSENKSVNMKNKFYPIPPWRGVKVTPVVDQRLAELRTYSAVSTVQAA